MNLNVFIKFVLCIKTNKNKPTKIITPLLLKPTDISARAMPRAKKPFQPVYQGPRWVQFMGKNAKNNVTLPL